MDIRTGRYSRSAANGGRLRLVVGASTNFELYSPNDRGLQYAMMLSLADQPRTPLLDGRSLPLSLDALSAVTLDPANTLPHNSVAPLATDTERSIQRRSRCGRAQPVAIRRPTAA